MKKWFTICIYLVLIVTVYVFKDEILNWMQYGDAPLLLIFLAALGFIIVPIIPYKIVIGMLGFMYGPLMGALISWTAASIASVIVFWLARYLFQKQGRAYLSKYEKLEKLQTAIEKNPFLTILLARLIPVIPQAVVNVIPAITSVPVVTFAVASALGKIPAMLLFAFIGSSLFAGTSKLVLSVVVYILFLASVYLVYRVWLKKRWV
ncbi:TVP38/TMEM64 family protein [Paenibacillus chondroitinus]|uniref:TVP38/TMEM64 family membrane protein n=1 Tax=Paenibacillus chondroitinus TaxID=59842 RepID=A0ABU6DR35_9BACL|nr:MULTISPECIES: TVP38/TMEM64 family protein [Paenibacillus]MCY9663080.1 TVP38/TMEM64 family protein [Paenibacillus anseongense]MEB4799247.1 TVP38/TMEM64 family protein [Paenibacillus chondroitinus]